MNTKKNKVTLPGLIDIHVHLRTPGETHKEDFFTGTSAALSAGFTTVLDMPNNKTPIKTRKLLNEKIKIAKKQVISNIGFYFSSQGDNLDEFKKIKNLVFGLKLYLNPTTGNYLINEKNLGIIYESWNLETQGRKPILLHAEENVIPWVEKILKKIKQPTHFCHISSKNELSKIINLKNKDFPVTCGVTLHHLFLTSNHLKKLGPYALMKPFLKTAQDVKYLWENLDKIDVIESDHAPHLKNEKESKNPPFGIPGLETALPLLLTAMNNGKISLTNIKRLCHDNPKKIFDIPDDNSVIEIDLSEKYTIKSEELFTKCKWSPFNGWKMQGRVKKVTINKNVVFDNGKILAKQGSGRILKPNV